MTSNDHRLPGNYGSRTAVPSKDPGDLCSPAPAQPMRQLLKDLELPLAMEVDDICRRRSSDRGPGRQRVEEEIKLQYFFGGQDVAYLTTPDGLMVVVVGDLRSDFFGRALEALSADERHRVTVYSPDRWNDATSALLTPVADEA
jgi:hypothetical protein